MSRGPDKNKDKAKDLFLKGTRLIDIANQLNLPEGTIRGWKSRYKWGSNVTDKKQNVTKRHRGGQPGNHNAKGGPPGNKYAEKHGFFSKYLPDETKEIIDQIANANPLDLLWHQIEIAYAAIIRAQKIMYVKDSKEIIEEQTASDRQYNFLQAQAKAQGQLRNMIKQYDDTLHANWDLATEEQKLRITKMQTEIKQPTTSDTDNYKGIPATMIAPCFAQAAYDIAEHMHTEYVFPGGRGSTKSSFVSLNVIDLLKAHPEGHAVVLRQVADTMRGSIYQQIAWAIEALGLESEWHGTVSPMEYTNIKTGQKIYFRGADDPGKLKSIKVPFGYVIITWFEELDQFTGPEAVRKIEQSVIRGGDLAWIFKSFNPPKTASNWANMYVKIPKETRLVTESNYTMVPPKWLGKPFLDEAIFLKEVNYEAYENEYLGVANGSGGMMFDNVVLREITDQDIQSFDQPLNGVDWGWYPDPFHFACCYYDAARLTLYIYGEIRANKLSNRETADMLINYGITGYDLITCDSAEQKSVDDYKSYGLMARAAEKGPNSREYSYKWLQSLKAIVIDNVRCPKTADEFLCKEYDRDKDGNVISGYPDGDDHSIDAVRYATERIWRKRGL